MNYCSGNFLSSQQKLLHSVAMLCALFGGEFLSSQASGIFAQSPEGVAIQEDSAAVAPAKPAQHKPGNAVDLLVDDLSRNWNAFSSRDGCQLKDVWNIVDVDSERHLVCVGEPKGFLFTKKQYANFELSFEWRYPKDPNGNSGVLIYTQNEPRLWPTSMQVQLHQPQAGALFASGDAVSDRPFDDGVMGKVSEWNLCRIVSRNGRLSVEVNGQKAGQAEGCRPAKGFIGLQSEGSETHFRRILLKELAADAVAESASVSLPATSEDPAGR